MSRAGARARPHARHEGVGIAPTSHLGRTQETLAATLDGRDMPMVVARELDEIHFGEPVETELPPAAQVVDASAVRG